MRSITAPTTAAEFDVLVDSIPPVGSWLCAECVDLMVPFEDCPDVSLDILVWDSASNYGKPRDHRTSCEWCGSTPRDMIYHTMVFPRD